jgi:hypothetical protein
VPTNRAAPSPTTNSTSRRSVLRKLQLGKLNQSFRGLGKRKIKMDKIDRMIKIDKIDRIIKIGGRMEDKDHLHEII